jgi:hypothetical protein
MVAPMGGSSDVMRMGLLTYHERDGGPILRQRNEKPSFEGKLRPAPLSETGRKALAKGRSPTATELERTSDLRLSSQDARSRPD